MKLKWQLPMLVLAFSCNTGMASGNACHVMPGVTSCGRGVVSHDMTTNGSMHIQGTRIQGKTTVNGGLRAQKAILNGLVVNGGAELNQTLVKGSATINGGLKARDCVFKTQLVLASNKVTLSGSRSVSIVFGHSSSQPQHLYVLDGSTVEGSVVFNDGEGVVHLSQNSTITGKVVGGKVER